MPRRVGAFPTTLPIGSVQKIIDFLRNQNPDKWDAIEAVYDMIGYGLHVFSGRPVVRTGLPNDEDAIKELERLMAGAQIQTSPPIPPPEPTKGSKVPESTKAEVRGSFINLNIPEWFLPWLVQLLLRLTTT